MPINKAQNLEKYLAIATQAALDGGEILRKYWGKLEHIEEKGASGDLVTEADKKSEKIILELLQSNFPEHQILAEESGIKGNKNSEYLWAIDPLDGTTNYAHGYPVCAVSIGLLINGSPQVGVIYNPFRDELFQGIMGQGASLNHSAIRVSSTDELSKSLLVSGFAYDRCETEDNNYREFCHLTHLTQGVRRSGSAAVDLSDVACGRLDGYWERGIKPWDMVAGIVLVREAGGQISAYDQSPLDLNSGRILATNGKIHSSLSNALINTPSLSLIH
jgi:myo-inositol-1(or 4)-monophosphatase